MRAFYAEGHTRELAFRKKYLRRLLEAVKAREAETAEALYADLHKSREEAYISETAIVLAEIRDQLRHLERRARSRRVPTPPVVLMRASATGSSFCDTAATMPAALTPRNDAFCGWGGSV